MGTSIFLSHSYPSSPEQARKLAVIRDWLAGKGACCTCLPREANASLSRIRSAIDACDAVLAYAMPKFDAEASGFESPWVHMEAAMAFQARKPMAILFDPSLPKGGMLDPKATGLPAFAVHPAMGEASLVDLLDKSVWTSLFEMRRTS